MPGDKHSLQMLMPTGHMLWWRGPLSAQWNETSSLGNWQLSQNEDNNHADHRLFCLRHNDNNKQNVLRREWVGDFIQERIRQRAWRWKTGEGGRCWWALGMWSDLSSMSFMCQVKKPEFCSRRVEKWKISNVTQGVCICRLSAFATSIALKDARSQSSGTWLWDVCFPSRDGPI